MSNGSNKASSPDGKEFLSQTQPGTSIAADDKQELSQRDETAYSVKRVLGDEYATGAADPLIAGENELEKANPASPEERISDSQSFIQRNPGTSDTAQQRVKITEARVTAERKIIIFSRTTEDTELGTKALEIGKEDTVLVVAGSGDQVLDALCFTPKKVIACDISSDQLGLTRVKLICAKYLSREEFAAILGLYENESHKEAQQKRLALWLKTYGQAQPAEREVLDLFKNEIEAGIVDVGKSNTARAGVQKALNLMDAIAPDYTAIIRGKKGTPEDRAKYKLPKLTLWLLTKAGFLARLIISPRIVKTASKEHLQDVYAKSLQNFYRIYLYGAVRHPLASHLMSADLQTSPADTLPLHLREKYYPVLQRMAQADESVDFLEGDMGTPDFWENFEPGSLDKVYASSVPVYLDSDNKNTFWESCAEATRNGGLVFTCSHDTDPSLPAGFTETYQPRQIDRKKLIGDRPSNYNQELLYENLA